MQYPARVPSIIRQFINHNWLITSHDDKGYARYRLDRDGKMALVWWGVEGDYSWAVYDADEDQTLIRNGRGEKSVTAAIRAAEGHI